MGAYLPHISCSVIVTTLHYTWSGVCRETEKYTKFVWLLLKD
jgi:hypothetical protein